MVALYADGVSLDKIGARYHVAGKKARSAIEARGVPIRTAGQRRRYPDPEERTCAGDGCDVRFTPTPSKAAQGEGRYCSKACSARVASAISNELRKNGEFVTCPGCGGSRYLSASRLERGSRYCSSECYHLACRKGPSPAPRQCLSCSKTFTPRFPAFDATYFCSRTCWALYRRSDRPETLVPLMRTFAPRIRQKALGRLLGAPAGRLGGRPRVTLTEAQRAEVAQLDAQGWGRRAIANRLLVSEWAVRNALES